MQLTISPEVFSIVDTYIKTGLSSVETAEQLGLSEQYVSEIISKKEAQAYISQIFLETGWANRTSLMNLLGKMLEQKIQEAEENEMPYTSKDTLDIIKEIRALRKDETEYLRTREVNTQVNIQNNYGELLDRILRAQ